MKARVWLRENLKCQKYGQCQKKENNKVCPQKGKQRPLPSLLYKSFVYAVYDSVYSRPCCVRKYPPASCLTVLPFTLLVYVVPTFSRYLFVSTVYCLDTCMYPSATCVMGPKALNRFNLSCPSDACKPYSNSSGIFSSRSVVA